MSESKYTGNLDFKSIYYNYSVSDLAKLLDYIQQQEAIEEAINLDNPMPKTGGNRGSK